VISKNKALTYDDVLLVPQYSDIESRKEVDIKNDLDERICLNLPVISSPMDTVTEGHMVSAMYAAGGLGIIHRYNTIKEQCEIVRKVYETFISPFARQIGGAVGVTGDYLKRAVNLFDAGVNIICIDVAHGHHVLVKRAIESIRDEVGPSVHIMAGNIATREGFEDLADWGADSIRCNVGGGSICSTRVQTGHGVPGLQTIMDCATSGRDTKIIADGGIKSSGDIVKALAAGADFVMLGSMLASTEESPGFMVVDKVGNKSKTYRGMASKEAQMNWRGKYSSNEGITTMIPYKGSVENVLEEIRAGITSGFSYSGARNIKELQAKAQFIRQTSAGLSESHTHILRTK
jgi:IMP dehydrogenase